MSNDPDRDDRVYCARCLHLLNPDTDYPEPDEAVACPYCRAGLLVAIRHDQMRTERAIRRADYEAAREDGLIRPRNLSASAHTVDDRSRA